MASFAELTARLNLNIQNFAQNMQKASALASKFAANLQGKINAGILEPTKKSKFAFKDVSRIVQGIIVSKIFYSTLNDIRNATDAVWEFSNQLEYAKMAYTNLFGDVSLANEFINVLKDFAAVTPFSFKQAEQAAKRLLAYGIEYKNVMYVMQGVVAAATVQGSDTAIESISRAIGQIYTKGRLMNEEMRQLAEAGIPAYEILQEKLGLTAEQLRRLGDNAIPADVAINALIEGINERFGSTLENAAKTTQGIISNLVDNVTMLFAGIFEPLINKTKNFITRIGSLVASLRNTFELKGIGGVFEQLIPPSLQPAIKQLIANIKILWDIIKSGLNSALKILKVLLENVLNVINATLPIILSVAGAIGTVVKAIVENKRLMQALITVILGAAGAWAIYRLQALLATVTTTVIKGMIKAIEGLIKALNFLIAHPIWALLAVGAGLFLALTGASERFRESLSNLFKGFYSMGGIDVDKLLLPDIKERANDLDKFNKALSGTSGAIDAVSDASRKAAKNLMSFDEVFTIDTSSEDSADGIESFIPDFTGLDFSNLEISIPPVDEIATNFVDNLSEALGGGEKILGAAIGSILGGALGMLMGGPLGAKIGMLLGGVAGWFWDEFAAKLGLTDVGKIAIPITTVLGAAIGFIAGGPLGALIGGGIGLLVGWLIDEIAKALETGDWSTVTMAGGTGLGAAIGFIAGGPVGALIGSAIGALIGWITNKFIEGFTTGNWDVTGLSTSLGTGIGAAIGMVVGGPIGALIGSAIGALVGWITGLIIENWDSIVAWFDEAIQSIGNFFQNIWDTIKEKVSGAWNTVTEFFQNIWDTIKEKVSGAWNTVTEFFQNIWDTIKEKVSGAWNTVTEFFQNIWDTIKEKVSGAWNTVTEFFQNIWDTIKEKVSGAWNTVTEFFQNIWDTIKEKVSGAWNTVIEFFQNIWDTISEKVSGAWNTVIEFFQNIWDTISEKVSGAWDTVTEFFQNIWDTISEKVSGAWDTVTEFFQNIWDTITEKVSGAWDTTKENFQNIWDTITEKVSGAWDSTKENFQNIWDTISEKTSGASDTTKENFQNIWDTISEKLSGAWNSVSEAFSDIYDTISEKISDMYNTVKNGVKDIYDAFKDWIGDMWDNIFDKFFGWIGDAIDKLKNFFGLNSKAKNTSIPTRDSTTVTTGNATGGIFNREHIARIAEGNKAEAIIPLENQNAMQPFADAVANGVAAVLLPVISSMNNREQAQPILYVGTLIADDRGLKELERRLQIIRLSENSRRES